MWKKFPHFFTGYVYTFTMQNKNIEKAMKELGFYSLRPVQEVANKKFKEGNSFAIQAETGSGKTLAFLYPSLQEIDENCGETQLLILSPTRELSIQTSNLAKKLATYAKIQVVSCIGGIPIDKQINSLRHNPQVVIGTPGRLLDLYKQGYLQVSNIKRLILDEADLIISTGQFDETKELLDKIHSPVALFSATITDKVKKFLPEDSELLYLDDSQIKEEIKTYYIQTEDKIDTLFQYFKTKEITSCIVFVSHKEVAMILAKKLKERNILCSAFSSNYNERKRLSVLKSFKEGKIRVLVATDAMARGMDIQDISDIIHYELPEDEETLIHRSGRTAHNTSSGTVVTLLNASDLETKVGKYCLSHFEPYEFSNKKVGNLTRTIEKEKEKKLQVTELLIRSGRKDKIRPKDIIGALCTVFPFEKIGTLEIQENYSTVTIFEKEVNINELCVKGKKRKVEIKKA